MTTSGNHDNQDRGRVRRDAGPLCRDFVRNCRICIEKAPDCIEKHSGRYIKWVSSAEDTHSIMPKNMLEFLEVFESQFVEGACLLIRDRLW